MVHIKPAAAVESFSPTAMYRKSRKHRRESDRITRSIPDIAVRIDFEYVDFEGKKRRVVNGKIH
jgi:hypothetical protein